MARSGAWRILFYADLDGLKRINDEQGHAAGDHALKTFAEVVRRNIRSTDLFARVGGDEFLVFMKIKDPAFAGLIAERLHKAMNSVPQQDGGVSRCSLGALMIPPGRQQIDDLVRQADAVMYAAKVIGAALQVGTAIGQPSLPVENGGRNQMMESPWSKALRGRVAARALPRWHVDTGVGSASHEPAFVLRRRKDDPAW